MSRIEKALEQANRLRQAKEQPAVSTAESDVEVLVEAPGSADAGPAAKRSGRALLLGAGVTLLLLTGVLVFLIGTGKRSGNKSGEAPAPREARGDAAGSPATAFPRAPSAIAGARPDANYSATHPGWEQFKIDQFEYRVFREKGAIQAVQVIAHQDGGISHLLFNTLLREIAGGDTYRINSADKQKGYLVERGTGENGTTLLIYRKENGQITGFVASAAAGR